MMIIVRQQNNIYTSMTIMKSNSKQCKVLNSLKKQTDKKINQIKLRITVTNMQQKKTKKNRKAVLT